MSQKSIPKESQVLFSKESVKETRPTPRRRRYTLPSDWELLVVGLILFVGGLIVLGVSLARLWMGA